MSNNKRGGVLRARKFPTFTRNADIDRNAHSSSEKLWKFSESMPHPLQNNKHAIASIQSKQAVVKTTIPNASFKTMQLPWSMNVMSIETEQPFTQGPNPQLDPFTFAQLMNVNHELPKGMREQMNESTFLGGQEGTHSDIMRMKSPYKWKTSYSKPPRPLPYQRLDKNTSGIALAKAATTGKDANLNSIYNPPEPTDGPKASSKTSTVAGALGRLIRKMTLRPTLRKRYMDSPTKILLDRDFRTIVKGLGEAAIDATGFGELYNQATQSISGAVPSEIQSFLAGVLGSRLNWGAAEDAESTP